MKLSSFPIIIFFIITLQFSCRKTIDTPNIPDSSNTSVLVSLKSSISQTFAHETVTISFDSVLSDSRCPKNAKCTWAGTAVARFSLTKNKIKYSFSLSTLRLPGIYLSDTILAGYKIKFLNLSPYPELLAPPLPADKIKAEVEITPQ